MDFVPSRDLPSLHTRGGKKGKRKDRSVQIGLGLDQIAKALGVLEGEEEHLYFGEDVNVDSFTSTAVDDGRLEGDDKDGEEVFELGFMKGWLNQVTCLRWLPIPTNHVEETSSDKAAGNDDDDDDDDDDNVDEILAKAARLVAVCAGKSASGKSRKVYHFTSLPSGLEIIVRLQDQVLVEDSLGSRTWGAAPLLASIMIKELLETGMERCQFDRDEERYQSDGNLRVLELGAGTGLAGLAVAQFFQSRQGRAEVYLTDYHPDVLTNLRGNAELNNWNLGHESSSPVRLSVSALDWRNTDPSNGPQGRFDLLIAADCVYEAEHAQLLFNMTERFLSRQDQTAATSPILPSKLLLLSPLRSTHEAEIESITTIFPPYSPSSSSGPLQLLITHQQDVVGRDDFGPPKLYTDKSSLQVRRAGREVVFRLFVIQWCRR